MGLFTAVALVAANSGSLQLVIMIAAFVGIFYFIAIRPQRRQRQKHIDMLTTLKKGDEIVTVGGMYGVVKKIGNEYIELEVANRTKVKFLKRAISSVISEEEEYEEEVADEIVDVDAEEADSNDEAPTKR